MCGAMDGPENTAQRKRLDCQGPAWQPDKEPIISPLVKYDGMLCDRYPEKCVLLLLLNVKSNHKGKKQL